MKNQKKDLWQVRKNKLKKVFQFSIFLSLSITILFYFYKYIPLIPLTFSEAKIIALITGSKGINNIIEVSPKFSLTITKECSGYKTFVFLFSLILATPLLPKKRKIILLLITPLISFFINIARITFGIYLALFTKTKLYVVYDKYLLALINSLLILYLWYVLALKKISRSEK